MLEFLYAALNEPHGIVVKTSDVERLRQRLYSARREAKDTSLDVLSLVPSPTSDDELWIVKKGSPDAAPQGE